MEIDVRSQNSTGDPHDHGYNDASRERARLVEIRARGPFMVTIIGTVPLALPLKRYHMILQWFFVSLSLCVLFRDIAIGVQDSS